MSEIKSGSNPSPNLLLCVLCAVLVAQLCLALCDPMDYSPPGSSVHGDSPGKNAGVGAMPSFMGSGTIIYPVAQIKNQGVTTDFSLFFTSSSN